MWRNVSLPCLFDSNKQKLQSIWAGRFVIWLDDPLMVPLQHKLFYDSLNCGCKLSRPLLRKEYRKLNGLWVWVPRWTPFDGESFQNRFHSHVEITSWKCRCERHDVCQMNLEGGADRLEDENRSQIVLSSWRYGWKLTSIQQCRYLLKK